MQQRDSSSPTREELLSLLLTEVKRHASTASSSSQHPQDADDNFLVRRQLEVKITDAFKLWFASVTSTSCSCSSSSSACEVCEEIEKVGDACFTLLSMRLKHFPNLADHEKDEEEQENENSNAEIEDYTINLVLECCSIFFLHSLDNKKKKKKNNNHHHTVGSLLQQTKTESKWIQLIKLLCQRKSPLGVALKGFRFLVGFVLHCIRQEQEQEQNNNDSKGNSSSAVSLCSKLLTETLFSDFSSPSSDLLTNKVITTRLLRLASALHESFSSLSTRVFCNASGFDKILSNCLLAHCPISKQKNEKEIDALVVATLFTALSSIISCCGPQSLSLGVSQVLAKYLKFPSSSYSSVASEDEEESDGLDLNTEILRPFAHQTTLEIFQRGTISDEEHQEKEKKKQKSREKEFQQRQQQSVSATSATSSSSPTSEQVHADEDDGADDEESNDVNKNVVTASSPWSIFISLFNLKKQEEEQKEGESLHLLLRTLLLQVNSEILRENQDLTEVWVRSVSALFSSSFGIFTSQDLFLKQQRPKEQQVSSSGSSSSSSSSSSSASSSSCRPCWSYEELIRELSMIIQAILEHSVSSNTTSSAPKAVAMLNCLQSLAVPLSGDIKNLTRFLVNNPTTTTTSSSSRSSSNSSSSSDAKSENISQKEIIIPKLIRLIESVGVSLTKTLHGSSNNNNNDQQSFFARVIFPLSRGTGNAAASEKVQEAFWTMIEQLISSPPFADILLLLNLFGNSEEKQSVVTKFMDCFIEPVLAPMCPLLVSLLSTTAQKEIGRELYLRRRGLAVALLRVEQLCSQYQSRNNNNNNSSEKNNEHALICGCSRSMWEKLKESVLVAGGGL